MFDFIRNLTKSEKEKRQEAIAAYLDGELTSRERERFTELIASDESLRVELEQQRFIKSNLSHIPSKKAPRNFTLDPAVYGRSQSRQTFNLYPALRTATVIVSIFFIVVLSADFLSEPNRQAETSDTVTDLEQASEIISEGLMVMEEAPAEEEQAEAIITEMEAESAAPIERAVEEEAAEEFLEESAAGEPAELAESEPQAFEPTKETGLALPSLSESLSEIARETPLAQPESEDLTEERREAPLPIAPPLEESEELFDAAQDEDESALEAEAPLMASEEEPVQPVPTLTIQGTEKEQSFSKDTSSIASQIKEFLASDSSSPFRIIEFFLGITVIILLAFTLLQRRKQ